MKTILVDAVYCFVIERDGKFEIFKKMYDMLETFPNRKILLTGATDEKFKVYGLDKMPYEVFTLKQNPVKSDPKYYELMLEHFGFSKDDVIHFEHNEGAIKSAQSVAIKTYSYDEEKMDLTTLRQYLQENL